MDTSMNYKQVPNEDSFKMAMEKNYITIVDLLTIT